MASIPSNGYREVMAGTNVYTGSNFYGSDCPKTPIVPVDPDDLCNKLYVDTVVGGGSVVSVTGGNNITVSPTTVAPVVSLQSPLTATLALGTQDITAVNGVQSLTINALGIDKQYTAVGANTAVAQLLTSGGGDPILGLGSTSVVTGQGHLLEVSADLVGTAKIEHLTIGGGTARDLAISTQGVLGLTAGSRIDLTPFAGQDVNVSVTGAGSLNVTSDTVGGIANPLLVLQNNNNTAGGTTFETYKNDLPTSTGGDPVGIWTASCNTNIGKTEITRISAVANGIGAGNNDGSLVLACKVNSGLAPVNFINCNGGAGTGSPPLGEVQLFKPLNMTGQNIITTSGNLTVDGTTSSGNGTIFLNPKTGANGYVAINTAGGSNLRLDGTINNLTAPTTNTIDMAVGTLPVNGFTINRNLVKLDYQQAVSNDVSVLQLENNPTGTNQLEASYLQPATGDLQQTILATTPANHSLQFLDPTAGRTTKVFNGKVELEVGGNDITLDAGAFPSGVQMFGTGTDGSISNGSFTLYGTAAGGQLRLQSEDISTTLTKTLVVDNNYVGNTTLEYTNNTGDGSELTITSNTDISIGTVGGTGNSVFIDAQNETTVSSGNQMSLKVFNASQPLTIEVNNTGGYLNFVGTDLQSASSSGTASQYLAITLNGIQYKIPLDLP